MDVTSDLRQTRKRVTHRASLAPDRPHGQWTVADFRQFVKDCETMGIPDDTPVIRQRDDYSFSGDGGPLMAERHTSLD